MPSRFTTCCPPGSPARVADLLAAHRTLMSGLVDDAGAWRRAGVGVMAGERVIHMAPQARRVPQLMANLLRWLAATDAHPLIASSVFHYEFEFIHPFSDGNGRMGRLWQTLILSRWNPLFAEIPVESLVHEQQDAYYQAIQASTQQSDAAPFVEFMLNRILEAVTDVTPQVTPQVAPQVERLLCLHSSRGNDPASLAGSAGAGRQGALPQSLPPARVGNSAWSK